MERELDWGGKGGLWSRGTRYLWYLDGDFNTIDWYLNVHLLTEVSKMDDRMNEMEGVDWMRSQVVSELRIVLRWLTRSASTHSTTTRPIRRRRLATHGSWFSLILSFSPPPFDAVGWCLFGLRNGRQWSCSLWLFLLFLFLLPFSLLLLRRFEKRTEADSLTA